MKYSFAKKSLKILKFKDLPWVSSFSLNIIDNCHITQIYFVKLKLFRIPTIDIELMRQIFIKEYKKMYTTL